MSAELAIIARLQDEASSGVRALRGEIEGLGESAGGVASKGFQTLQTVGTAALTAIAGVAIAAGAALAGFAVTGIQKAAELEAQMDTVAALLGATADQADLLRQAVMDLSLDPNLKVSATEAAQAIEMLAQNGLSVEEILGGAARATVLLANATGADFTVAARIATDAMALWGMEAEDLGRVADGVTAVLVQSKFEVNDYALALAQAGGVAAAVGVSFDDFNATLVAIAPYFASGSDAGTSYKTMLQRLIPTTTAAKDAMYDLGLITEDGANAFFDSQGNMRDMAEVAGLLHNALGGLTEQQRLQALSTIFGTDAMRAAAAMSQFTEEEFRNLMAVMANTSAAEIAAQRMQNFSGAMDILRGVIEGLQIMLGNVLLPILTQLALAGANLLAAWGPPIIAAFERLVGIFQEFAAAIQGGTAPLDAFVNMVGSIAEMFGASAAQVEAVKAGVEGLLTTVGNIVGPVAQFIASFVSWKDVLVVVGIAIASVVIPALLGFVSAAAPIVAVVGGLILAAAALRNAWESDFLGIRTAVEQFAAVLGQVFGVLRAVVSGDLSAFMEAFRQLPAPVQAVVTAIVNFASLLQSVFGPTVDRIREALGNLGENLSPVGEKLVGLKDAFLGLLQALAPVGAAIAAVVGVIAMFLGEVLAGIINNAGTIIGGLVTFVTGVVDGVRNAVQALVDIVRAILQGDWAGAWEAAKSFLSGWVDSVRTQLQGLLQIVDGVVGTIWDAVVNTFNNLTGAALPSWEEFKARVMEVFNSIPEEITGSISNWLAAVGNVIQAVKDALTGEGSWSDVGAAIMEAIRASFEASVAILSAAFGAIRDAIFAWAGAEDWSGVAQKIIEMIGNAIAGAVSFVTEKFGALRDAIFTWAGAEDWQEVGETIVERVGDALATAGTAISDKLGEWQTAIFDWAGAEDWQGVADHIAEGVGEKLGEAGDAISGQLNEWQQAIFDWAGAEDWQGVADHIAEGVGEKLGEAGDAISGQLNEWQTAIFDWADAEDWQGVADHIAEGVGEKLGEAGDAISGQLSEWQQAIFDWADAEDWQGVAQTIAERVGESLSEAADTLATNLEPWQQAIFDWAEAEDWQGVAQTIAERVGASLGEAASTLWDGLNSWEQAIFDWADGADWGDVSESIAERVGDALVDVSDRVTDKLSSWITAFTDWVNSVDWYQVGYDIMFKITDAFLDFKQALTEKVAGWLADTKSATEGYAWYEVGAYILLKIVESAAGLVSDWFQTVAAWVSNIAQAVQQHLANLAQVGRDLVAGIAAGIAGAVDLIKGAIAGVIAGAEPAAREAAQSNSPSRLMMPVGYDLSAGVAVGIAQGAGTVITAIRGVADQAALEGVKAFGEAMKAIGEGIEAAIRAYILASGFGDAGLGSAEGLGAIVEFMRTLVAAFAEANSYTAEALQLVGQFAETAGAIVDLVSDSLLPLRILAAVDLSWLNSGNLAAGMAALRNFLIAMVGGFVEAAAELGVLGSLVEAFTAAAEGVIGLVEDALRAAALLSGFNFGAVVQDWHLRDQIVTFRNIVRTMVREFAEAALEFAFMSEAVQMFTEAAESVIGLVEDGLQAAMFLSGFNFGAVVNDWHLRDQIILFRNIVRTMVREFAEAALEFGFMGDAVTAFTDAAEGVIGLVEEGLLAVALLAGFNFGPAVADWHLRDQIVIFRNIVRTMVREFAEAALEFGAMAASVEAFADAAEGVIGLVEDGLAAAVMLSEIDFGPVVNGWHLAEQIEIFRNIIRTLVREFSEAAAEFGSMADAVSAFAEAAGAVLELVIDGIEAVTVLSETDFGPIVNGWHLAEQIEIFRNIIRTLIREFAEAAAEFGSMAESVQAFAEAAGAVVDLIGPALEAIGELAAYSVDTGALGAAVQRFVTDLTFILATLVEGLRAAGLLTNDAVVAAGDLAGSLGDLLELVGDGVEALVVLATYVPNANLVPTAQRFAADLAAVLMAVVGGLQAAGVLTSAAVTAAGELADGLADVLGMVADGVEALVTLATYVPNANLMPTAQRFATDLAAVITTVVQALVAAQVLANEAVVQAGELSDGLADILGVVADGVEAITALGEYVPAAGIQGKAQQFATDLAMVITTVVNGLQAAGVLASQAVAAAGEMADRLSDLLGVVGDGIEAIQAIAEYKGVEGLQEKVQKFTSDLIAVASTLATRLTEAANTIGSGTIDAARAFATAVTGLVAEVTAAVGGLGELGNIQTPNIEPKLQYIVQSAQQIQQGFSAAGDIGQAVQYAAAFRQNLEQLVAEVQAAVAQLAALAGAGTSGSVQEALNRIAAALQNTEGQFAGAGTALANALIEALRSGVSAGEGQVVQATTGVLTAANNAGQGAARDFTRVGDAIIDAMVDGVQAGQSQLIAAVVQVVGAAVAAGLSEARRAADVGRQFMSSLLTEMNAGRSTMDSSGNAVGNALIEGMARAITAGRSRVVNAIIDTIRAAIQAAQQALGIASPSKVAAALFGNFMDTGARRLGDPRGLVAAAERAVGAMVAAVQGNLSPLRLMPAAMAVPAGSPASRTAAIAPVVRPRAAGSAAGTSGMGSVVIYGDLVLPNVSDTRSFLEEMDALRGGGR